MAGPKEKFQIKECLFGNISSPYVNQTCTFINKKNTSHIFHYIGRIQFMYAVYDGNKLIAYHDEKRVVKQYCESINQIKHKQVYYVKIPKRIWMKKWYDPDLYLIRFGKTFIQSGYAECIETDYNLNLSELYLTKDILMKVGELYHISPKEMKSITKSIVILEKIIHQEETLVPTLEELKQIKSHLDEFRYHISDLETDDYLWNH